MIELKSKTKQQTKQNKQNTPYYVVKSAIIIQIIQYTTQISLYVIFLFMKSIESIVHS